MAKTYVTAENFNQPTMHQVHLDAAMSNISIAYRNPAYVADQVFPIVRVQKQSDER
jgi:hypothetical protein